MWVIDQLLPNDRLVALIRMVVAAYDPRSNRLRITQSELTDLVCASVGNLVGRTLRFYCAYLFLVTDTTIETARRNPADGWHVDGTSLVVNDECFNVWIPLFNSSSQSGLEVIPESNNRELYEELHAHKLPWHILVRPNAEQILDRIASYSESDFFVVFDKPSQVLELTKDLLNVSTIENASVGQCVIFKQTELHRGTHKDGVRIQLTIKLVVSSAKVQELPIESDRQKAISKHGRLEYHLVRELLGAQIAKLDAYA